MSKGIHEPLKIVTTEQGLQEMEAKINPRGGEAFADYAKVAIPVLTAEIRRLRNLLHVVAERTARGEFHGMSAEYIFDAIR